MTAPALFGSQREGGRAPSMSKPGEAGNADQRPISVLIVEDEVFVALHLEGMVEAMGYVVTTIAPDAQSALDAVAGDPPDVILLDVNLGEGLTGVDVAERLAGSGVDIIFVTAYSDPVNRARMMAAAPDCRILSKPVEAQSLRRVLKNRPAH